MRTYSVKDLLRLAGLPQQTFRQYAKRGLLPSPKGAGEGARYSRETLARLAAIGAWRRQKMALEAIKVDLRDLSADELERWASSLDPIGLADAPTTAIDDALTIKMDSRLRLPTPEEPLDVGERWVRVPLVPGLDLTLREGAGELAVRLAKEIQQRYRLT